MQMAVMTGVVKTNIMNTLKERLLHYFIIGIFCSLYFLVATISMINSVAFFDLSHSPSRIYANGCDDGCS